MIENKPKDGLVWCLQEVSPTYFKVLQVELVYFNPKHDTCIVCDSGDVSFAISKQNLFLKYCDANSELISKNIKIAIKELKTISASIKSVDIDNITIHDIITKMDDYSIVFEFTF